MNQVVLRFCFVFPILGAVGFSSSLQAWIAKGEEEFHISRECKPEVLREKLSQHFYSAQNPDDLDVWRQLETNVQEYFDRCGDELDSGSVTKLVDYAELSYVEYDFASHPNFRPVSFLFPEDEIRYRGYLGLKPGKRRPLVIFKCGLSCDFGDPALRLVAMMFHDMGPFHVLLLPSNSGEGFIGENKIFAVGGLQEGRQIVRVAQLIESGDWDYSEWITKIHLFGMSLGGHAAYYASVYADHLRRDPQKEPLFASTAVGCPVVNFKKSLEHITGDSMIAKLLRRTILANVVQILSNVTWFDEWLGGKPDSYNPSQEELREMLVSGTYDFYKRKLSGPHWAWEPFGSYAPGDSDQIWGYLDASRSAIPELRSPVFSWAPKDDDVVLYGDNSRFAYDADATRGEERRIFKLETEVGGHCAFPSRFGWQASSVVFNSIFESRSPDLMAQRRFRTVEAPRHLFKLRDRASGRRWRIRSRWQAYPNKDYVELETFFDLKRCRGTPGRRVHRCREKSVVKIPLNLLGLQSKAFLESDIEAEVLTRWLNSRITMENARGERIGPKDNPKYFRILEYQ